MNYCLMPLSLKSKSTGVNSMSGIEKIIHDKANLLRQQYNLGNYCGRSIFDIIEKLEIEGNNPLLFRLPFKNAELSGFVGYKNDKFAVYTNTNKTLGYQIFTAAHEIYHIVENGLTVKEQVVLQESTPKEGYAKTESSEILADIFAAELLMPEMEIKREYQRLMNKYGLSIPDESIIVMLQQMYFVEFKAVTKRLREIEADGYNEETESRLNQILFKKNRIIRKSCEIFNHSIGFCFFECTKSTDPRLLYPANIFSFSCFIISSRNPIKVSPALADLLAIIFFAAIFSG